MSWLWTFVPLAAVAYCAIRAVFDLRNKRYALAALGLMLAAGLLTMPMQTHAVKIDLPMR